MSHLSLEPNPKPDFYVNNFDFAETNILFRDSKNKAEDAVFVYVPLELSSDAIMHRLQTIKSRYEFVDFSNELFCSSAVDAIMRQLTVYDQAWASREKLFGHSLHGTELVKEILMFLENWESTENFPGCLIEELRQEYQV